MRHKNKNFNLGRKLKTDVHILIIKLNYSLKQAYTMSNIYTWTFGKMYYMKFAVVNNKQKKNEMKINSSRQN